MPPHFAAGVCKIFSGCLKSGFCKEKRLLLPQKQGTIISPSSGLLGWECSGKTKKKLAKKKSRFFFPAGPFINLN